MRFGRFRQRGIFDFTFGEQETEQESTQSRTGTKEVTRDSTAERETTQTGSQQQQLVTQALPQEVQDVLVRLITGGGEEGGEQPDINTSGDIANLAREMADRARAGGEDINAAITDIIGARDREGRREIGRLMATLGRQGGGVSERSSSIVAAAGAEAQAQLQSELAAAEGQLRLQGRQMGTQELAGAIEALGAAPAAEAVEGGNIVQLVEALRGGTTTQTGTVTTRERTADTLTSAERLTEVIDMLLQGTSRSETDKSGFSFGL